MNIAGRRRGSTASFVGTITREANISFAPTTFTTGK